MLVYVRHTVWHCTYCTRLVNEMCFTMFITSQIQKILQFGTCANFNKSYATITSTKDVLFSLASVCLFVSRIMQNYSTYFPKIWWTCGTWATEKTDFGGNLDHVMLGLALGTIIVTVTWARRDPVTVGL